MFQFHLLRFGLNIARYVVMLKYTVNGRENLPAEGPFIMVTNHMSVVDSPLIAIALPPYRWRLFAGEKWKDHRIVGPLLALAGAIFINRGQVDRKALKAGMEALANGDVFGLAPEGSRSKDNRLVRGKDGAAYLASKANVTILPIGLVNTDQWIPTWKRLRITRIDINVGEPFKLPELGRRVKSRDLAAYTHLIMVKIAENLPPRYHGYYADSPALAAALRGEDPWPHCLAAEDVIV